MTRKVKTQIICVVITVLTATQIYGQGYVDNLPDEIKQPFQQRYTTIAAEIRGTQSNDWAGSYSRYIGETWSEVLLWTPNNGFAAFRDTCSHGPRAWVNFGSARFDNGLLTLNPEHSHPGEHSLPVKREFTPVRWGHQRWLVPTDELELFAYAVNSGSWEDFGAFYVKDGGGGKTPRGHPEIPKQFKHILNRKPLIARVLTTGTSPENWYGELTIDVGKNKGVIVGMSFWLTGVKNTNVKISFAEVHEKTAVARVIGVGYSYEYDADGNPKGSDPREFKLKPGLKFTSRS